MAIIEDEFNITTPYTYDEARRASANMEMEYWYDKYWLTIRKQWLNKHASKKEKNLYRNWQLDMGYKPFIDWVVDVYQND